MLSEADVCYEAQNLNDDLQHLQGLLEQIAANVQTYRWESLPGLLVQRQKQLESLFTSYTLPGQRHCLKEMADVVMEQDQVYMAIIKQQQDELEQQMAGVHKGKAAVMAYHV